ncbi:Uncharacterised protein [Mycobacterium tuberculosis]|nr:Uncharacterised protein [Mycobacterium tuberculosis]
MCGTSSLHLVITKYHLQKKYNSSNCIVNYHQTIKD